MIVSPSKSEIENLNGETILRSLRKQLNRKNPKSN